ncbi:TGF-beta-activated kinase 1 and MAP3K7-binding protein 3 isoform X2 [Rhinatrema bivittatum]|uniref:TGF-beta-activated kinase 1 and MAP3K7-binding protein 3 isoform X2 n=1 Tax=Rhinatrema bivittatum TaxID=194408 RepID=UPI0011271C35|nr:TGF-beta-activated kinase 1 and MAP3K7-binding protein 3 isoform X2 [Rhinatrema bivittatum]
MAQSGQQLDLQNNNNVEACCRALAQESSKYLYMEYHSSDETRTNRNHLLHINVGIHPHSNYQAGEGTQLNGGRTLVHSSSDGHIDPQCTAGKHLICLVQEPHSAPAVVAASPNYNPFFLNDQSRNTPTPPPQPPQQPAPLQPGINASALQGPPPSYMHLPRYTTSPITVTVSQNITSGPNVPRALQILPQVPSNPYGAPKSIYIRQTSQSSPGRQMPQNTQWHSSPQGPVPHYPSHPHLVYPPQNYQSPQYSPKQTQIPQSAFRSPPTSQCSSPFGSPQHQVQPNQLSHQTSHVFMPPSPSTVPSHSYQHTSPNYPKQGGHSVSYLPYGPGLPKSSMKKIEITVEPPQRPGTAMNRSPSPISSQPSQRSQHPLYPATTPSSNSPSRGMSAQPKPPFSVNPLYITHTQTSGHTGTPTPSRVMVSQPNPTVLKITVGRAPAENLLNLEDQEQHPGAPEPIQPISLMAGSGLEKGCHKYQRSTSSGSDDYAYTQALLLHQRARMERLAKELTFEVEKLEILKSEVNGMEHDLMQRRLRRVSCTTSNPTPEEMTRLRGLNRQLQINIDCTLKEVDLLQSRGIENFDPKAMSDFYKNLQTGPVVPPKPCKKDHQRSAKQAARVEQRDEDFEGAPWNCDSCTFLNHPAMNRCEECDMPRYT